MWWLKIQILIGLLHKYQIEKWNSFQDEKIAQGRIEDSCIHVYFLHHEDLISPLSSSIFHIGIGQFHSLIKGPPAFWNSKNHFMHAKYLGL